MRPAEALAPLPQTFYARPAEAVARDLLGCWLVRQVADERLVLRVVETEAYLGSRDRASHAWGGRRTARNASLYLRGGHAYVYFVYGIHFCLNAVTGAVGEGEAVLLRAGAAVEGGASMARRRKLRWPPPPGRLAAGPGCLCQALAVDRALDGCRLDGAELFIAHGEPVRRSEVVRGPRVGIAYAGAAAAWPLRFAVAGSREVSRPRL